MLRCLRLPGYVRRVIVIGSAVAWVAASHATVTFTDDFTTSVNYLTNGIPGTIWDGIYLGAGEIANATGVGTAPGSVSVADANITSNGVLTVASLQTDWEKAADDGVLFFKVITGDFDMSVHVLGPIDTNAFNLPGLMVRVFGAGGAPLQPTNSTVSENSFLWARFDESSIANMRKNNVNGVKTDTGLGVYPNTNYWLRVTRAGNLFTLFEKATQAADWTSVGNLTRADFSGAQLEVGIEHAVFGGGATRAAQYSSFSLTATNLGPFTSPPSAATGLTLATNGERGLSVSWMPGAGSSGSLVAVWPGTSSVVKQSPANGFNYVGNAYYGLGSSLPAAGWSVVYVGAGSSVIVSNLVPGTTYNVAVFSYSGSGSSIAYNHTSPVASLRLDSISCAAVLVASLPDLQLSKAGTINCITVQDDGQIVIGGSFTSVNAVPLRNLARINNRGAVDATWAPNPDGPVLALATSGSNLFVGGMFTNIAGQFRHGLALLRTTGPTEVAVDPIWAPFLDVPAVHALVLTGQSLFVGGAFTEIGYFNLQFGSLGKLATTGVGDYDPNWYPYADDGQVNALALSGTNLYVGGTFTSISGTIRKRLARVPAVDFWDVDPNWNPNIDPAVFNATSNSSVSSLLLAGSNVFVSGSFTNVGGNSMPYLAKVTTLGTGAVDAAWNPMPVTSTGNFALAGSGTSLFVGGQFTQIGGQNLTNLAKLTTTAPASNLVLTSWAPTINGPVTALLTNENWLLTGGSFSVADNTVTLGITKIDPGTGILDEAFAAEVASPGTVNAMVQQVDGKVIVGGDFWLAGQVLRPHLARIQPDGTLDTAWATAASGPVNALALSGTNLYVGGAFTSIGGQSRNGLAKVDTGGTDLVDPVWNPLTGPTNTPTAVYALATDNTNYVYVGGTNLGVPGQAMLSFMRVSTTGAGTQDTNWNTTANGAVRALALSQTNLFVGGEFSMFGTTNQNAVVKLVTTGNGVVDANWNPYLDLAGTPAIHALAASGTNLYLGGSFVTVGIQFRNSLVKLSTLSTGAVDTIWNPGTNQALNPLLDVYALAISGTNLYFAGSFATNQVNLARVSTTGIGVLDANWNPNSYVSVSPGTLQGAILPSGQDLFVGGQFQYIGGSYPGAPDSSSRNGLAYLAVADAPVIIKTSPTNLVIVPSSTDGLEITAFQITGITGGSLFLSNGIAQVYPGDFITVAQAAAGLVFSTTNGVVTAVASVNGTPCGAGTAATTLSMSGSQAPVFRFSSALYSTTEQAGFVSVTILKQGTGAASINFATANGSATAGIDYIATNGTLNFAAGQTSTNILITILDDGIFEGNESFKVNLSNPTAGASTAWPGSATVWIIETDPIGSVASSTSSALPGAVPPAQGILLVNITTPTNGQWRLEGQRAWHDSGTGASNLVTGNYRVEFKPVFGYLRPDALIASVVSGTTVQVTNSYKPGSSSGFGYISLLISPNEVATNFPMTNQGQWRRVGTTNWFNNAEQDTNLPAGFYDVEFKPVSGYTTPTSDPLPVFANQGVRITGLYVITNEAIGSPPAVQSFFTATNSRPYLYSGQIETDLGLSSGVVIKDHVVLTAAHTLFDFEAMTYVLRARWSYQQFAGSYTPVPLEPRGWHVFAGYAAKRALDSDPGFQTLQAADLDVAAMYFMTSAARGGFSGYLISDSNTNWLLTARMKTVFGYPMEVVDATNQGKLFAIPATNLTFSLVSPLVSSNVYSSANFSGFNGMAGGPLCVQADDTNFYPAGIYLGPSLISTSALVRVLDAAAADLIDRADLSGSSNLSVPQSSRSGIFALTPGDPGVATVNVISSPTGAGSNSRLQVNTGPQPALDDGGKWGIGTSAGNNWYLPSQSVAINPGTLTVTIVFEGTTHGSYAVPYRRPDDQTQLAAGVTQIRDFLYMSPPPAFSLKMDSRQGVNGVTFSGGAATYTYAVLFTTNLATPNWKLLWGPVTLTSPDDQFIPDPRTNRYGFYRGLWVPTPAQ